MDTTKSLGTTGNIPVTPLSSWDVRLNDHLKQKTSAVKVMAQESGEGWRKIEAIPIRHQRPPLNRNGGYMTTCYHVTTDDNHLLFNIDRQY